MLAFITTLRHPANAVDYGRVEALLQDTLRSIGRQTSGSHVTVVVGNRPPSFPLPHGVEFVRVDFDPPAAVQGAHATREAVIRDKGTKIGIGLAAARRHAPDHVMLLDADDFVHRGLAAHAERHPGRGWVVTRGQVYSRARGVIRPLGGFNGVCGSCLIVPWSAYGVPDDLPVTATQQEVAAAYGERLHLAMGAHLAARAWFAAHGQPLEPLPFRGAVYHVDTGENHSGKQLDGLALPLTARAMRTYGIPRRRPLPASAASGLGPEALAQTVARLAPRTLRRVRSRVGRLVHRLPEAG